MKSPRDIRISTYDYELPEDRIALKPSFRREDSKMLVFQSGTITDHGFNQLPQFLQKGDVLVFNNARVINARLRFKKETGGAIEIFCLEPEKSTPELALADTKSSLWKCLVGGAKKWKEGPLKLEMGDDTLYAWMIAKENDHFVIKFSWDSTRTFGEMLTTCGQIPLPPYIKRETSDEDLNRYQTVYSEKEGSVAAPTAGLHFTKEILQEIDKKGVERQAVTLHVGAGTFKPVESDLMGGHDMHAEWIEISKKTIEYLLNCEGSILSVGTTSTRTLESLYWLGLRIIKGMDTEAVLQWDPYEIETGDVGWKEAFRTVLNRMSEDNLLLFPTALIIAPPYQFKVVKGLVTNFHLPKSTLLLLVSALVGDDWKKVYRHALNRDYRFLSYGDSSLLLP